VLLETAPNPEDAVTVARKLREVLREPFLLEGRELYVSTSIGIAVHPEDGADVESLLKSSDIAMYRAKQLGGDGFQLYQPDMNARAEERLSLESSLRKALGLGQFALQFQPIVETATRRKVGFEALLRWHHPEKGLLMPKDFIELAEVTGVILDVGPWVLREACREAATWESDGPALSIAVNLSARQFHDQSLVQQVADTLAVTGLDPRRLELEITESLAMQSPGATGATLQALRALGVRLSIDDFGTGYSSLSYLKRFPVDILKVDRSFVREIVRVQDATIAATIVAMARTLGLRVVAEGVEEESQLEVLRHLDCDFAQGHLFGMPLWPERLRTSLETVP
jgi:EAL domain-containing protein (putative c-di-GMP-specific phosphodiesterase class I)